MLFDLFCYFKQKFWKILENCLSENFINTADCHTYDELLISRFVKFAKSFDVFILQSNCKRLLMMLKYVKIKHR